MITVNLLPYEFRPVKRTPLPYIASGGVLALTLCVMAIVLLKNFAEIAIANSQLNQHKAELAKLEPVVEEYNSISQKKIQLAEQVETINEIVGDRILWSRQLHNLNRLALDNMWYNGIEVSLKPFTETRTQYNPKTKKNETITDRIDRRVLTVTGYVAPGEDGMPSVAPFTIATESDEEFSNMFQLDLSTFKDTMFDEVGVREFKLEYVIRDRGTES